MPFSCTLCTNVFIPCSPHISPNMRINRKVGLFRGKNSSSFFIQFIRSVSIPCRHYNVIARQPCKAVLDDLSRNIHVSVSHRVQYQISIFIWRCCKSTTLHWIPSWNTSLQETVPVKENYNFCKINGFYYFDLNLFPPSKSQDQELYKLFFQLNVFF